MRSSSKKLSLLVAGAIGFGAAFSMTPSEALAATVVDQAGNDYSVNGKTMNYTNMIAAVKDELKKENADVQVNSSNVATALSGESLTLGKGSQLTVKGSTNTAKVVGGDTASTVSVDGTAVTGSNVNLKSITMTAKNNTAKLNVTGTVGTLDATSGNITMGRAGTLNVGTFTTKGANLTIGTGVTLNTTNATLGEGTKLSTGTDGSLSADTLTIAGASTVDGTATIKADTIVATSDDAASVLDNVLISSKTDGGSVKVVTTGLSSDAARKVTRAVETAVIKSDRASGSETTTKVTTENQMTGTAVDGGYQIGHNKVTKDNLDWAILTAYGDGATELTLDKETTKALQGTRIDLPANVTLTVKDTDGSYVSATTYYGSTLQVDGLKVSVPGTETAFLSNVTVYAPGKTLTNATEANAVEDTFHNARVQNVTVLAGNVKTGDAKVDNLTVKGGSVITDGTITATNVTLDGGKIVADTKGKTPVVKADTVTIKSVEDLKDVKIEAATDNGTVTVKKADGTAFTPAEIPAIQDSSASKVVINGKTSDGQYAETVKIYKTAEGFTVNGKTISEDDLLENIQTAFKNVDKVILDKGTTKALQGKEVGIPSGKTLVVRDEDGSQVSAKAKDYANVKVDGLSVTGDDNATFSDIVIDAAGKTMTNNLKNVKADKVTVKNGNVKTSDVTATNLTVEGGTVLTDGTVTTKTITLNGGKIASVTMDKTPTIKADTVTVKDVNDLKNLKIVAATEGGKVTVVKADGSDLTAEEINTIQNASASPVIVNGVEEPSKYQETIQFRKTDAGFFMNGEPVAEKDLADAVNKALQTVDRVRLDKESLKALQGKDITIPAGKRLNLVDGTGADRSYVSAKAGAKDATVNVEGTTLKGKNGAEFESITIENHSGKVLTNKLEDVTANSVHLNNGLVKTVNVKVRTLHIGGDAALAGIDDKTPTLKVRNVYLAPEVLANLGTKTDQLVASFEPYDAETGMVRFFKEDGSRFTAEEMEKLLAKTPDGTKVRFEYKVNPSDTTYKYEEKTSGKTTPTPEKPDSTAKDNAQKALEDANKAVADANEAVEKANKAAEAANKAAAEAGEAQTEGMKALEEKQKALQTLKKELDAKEETWAEKNQALENEDSKTKTLQTKAQDSQADWAKLAPEAEKEASAKTNPFTTKLKSASDVNEISSQASVLNAKINAYNAQVSVFDTAKDAFNAAVKDYNTMAKAYNTAVDDVTTAQATDDAAVKNYKAAVEAQQKAAAALQQKVAAAQQAALAQQQAQQAYEAAKAAYDKAMDEYNGTTTTTAKASLRRHGLLKLAAVTTESNEQAAAAAVQSESTTTQAENPTVQAASATAKVAEKAENTTTYDTMSAVSAADVTSLQNKFKAAVLDAGKTLAAPSVSAQRAALVISDVMSDNVLARTKDLRDGKAPVDQDGDNHVWFQIKHSDVDVDDSDVYKKSKVKYTNYQLGYDNKIADDAFGGAFLSTTTGSVDFKGSRANGSTDMKDSFFGGVYATQILPHGQYIDGMIHAGQFSSKYLGQSWTTKNVGATAAYGVKLQNESVMYNPYVQLRVDHVMTDDVAWAGNTVGSMSQNVFNTKLGVDVYGLNGQGVYGGIAYGHNFTGNYDATVNGFAMPTDNNRANIIYMKLGYRANIAKNTLFDLEAEKTFVDYDGWHATGRFNFFF